jgi:hypothetical protein
LAVVLLWVPLGLACLFGDRAPRVEDDGCSDNHAQYWSPDPSGAELLGAPLDTYTREEWDGRPEPADGNCNELQYHPPPARQDPNTFHVEPVLRVTNPDLVPPENASVSWTIFGLDGAELRSEAAEVYENDIVDEGEGFSIRPRVFIGEELRGKNLRIVMSMDVIDTTAMAGETPDAGTADGTTNSGGAIVTVSPEAAFYVTR